MRIKVPFLNVTKDNGIVHQGHLISVLDAIFPNEKKFSEQKKDTGLKDPITGNNIELDVWIPSLNICFEFQDSYHYETTWYVSLSLATVLQRDNIKKELVHAKGLTLVTVPCWWGGDKKSLVETMRFQRPDLFHNSFSSDLVPLNPPCGYFTFSEIPDVGELMLASFPTAPKASIITLASWWLGEKYDGLRCCWNPKNHTIYTRSCKEVSLIPPMVDLLPDIFTDNECWFGRGQYHHVMKLIKGDLHSSFWPDLRMMTFDVPSYKHQRDSFEERYGLLLANIIAMRVLCNSTPLLRFALQQIIEGGGEGGILRRRGSKYIRGRSDQLLKLKASQGDKEALVVGDGKRRSMHLKLPDGRMFVVSAENIASSPRPKIGDIVTFTYDSFARRELPVNPKICRIRTDLQWPDVLSDSGNLFFSDKASKQGFTTKPSGHWTHKNMRLLLEQMAKNRGMDPLLAETWYNTSRGEIDKIAGGSTIGHKMKGSYLQLLQALFPEIEFDHSKFANINYFYWRELEHRRGFFEGFAQAQGFNPHDPEQWYAQPRQTVIASPGAQAVMSRYNFSVVRALTSLFPNIGLTRSKFPYFDDAMRHAFRSSKNRRIFLENYAEERGFDPLVPENWYAQPLTQLRYSRGVRRILLYHNDSVIKAISELFPEVDIDPIKFHGYPQKYWKDKKNRRKFFEDFAAAHGFDPLSADHWYTVPLADIRSYKGGKGLLGWYQWKIAKALVDIFPDIGLDPLQFGRAYMKYWEDLGNRRKFFENFARAHEFDPLSLPDWIAHRPSLNTVKGTTRILFYYKKNLVKALLHLFPEISTTSQSPPISSQSPPYLS